MFGRDAINLLVTDLKNTVSGISPTPVVAPGWPTLDSLLKTVAKNPSGPMSISIYDRGPSKDASRFMLYTANEIVITPGTTSVLSQPTLPALGTTTITIGGTPVAGDAVSLVATNGRKVSAGVSVGASSGATSADVAQALSTAINAQSPLNTWLSASVTGSVVTVSNLLNSVLGLTTAVGNIGTRYTETDRKIRQVQVDLWAPTDPLRTLAGKLIDSRVAYLDSHFGFKGVGGTTDDGTWVRVRDMGDQFIDTDVYRNLYRWMWLITLEYPQTYEESIYSVLAFEPTFEVETPTGYITL